MQHLRALNSFIEREGNQGKDVALHDSYSRQGGVRHDVVEGLPQG